MKITRLEVLPVTIPYKNAYAVSVGQTKVCQAVILKLYTDAGIVGLGEASPLSIVIDRTGESQENIVCMLSRYFAPRLIGRDPFSLEEIIRELDDVSFGKHAALYSKCAVDLACYDIMGKALGVPAYQLLGGRLRSEVSVGRSLPLGMSPKEIAADAVAKQRDGYKSLTVKGSENPEADIACFRAVREAVDPDFPLEVDPNQAWSSANAVKTIKRLEQYDLSAAEQPLPWWDYDGMSALTQAVDTPIIADETVLSPPDAYQVAHRRMADMVTIKLAKNGGFFQAKKIVAIVDAAGLSCNMGSMHPLGVGTAAIHHFACSTGAVVEPIGYGSPLERLVDDILKEPIPFERGVARPPGGPGLGVELDDAKMKKYAVTLTIA